jgi:RND family efflux transporter MFP subunit
VLRLVAALCLLLTVACTPLAQPEEATPTPVPIKADEGKQTYEVQRGSIYDTIKGVGRIVSKEETPLYFKISGRLKSVNADIMQPVKKGDLLAELDTGDLKFKIDTARLNMEIAQIEVSRQVASSANVKSDEAAAAAGVVIAQSQVTRANNDLTKLEQGPLPGDEATAQAGVASAQAALEKAQTQVALLQQPPPQEQVIAAQAAAEKARVALQQAQANYDRIASRPDAAGRPEAVALQQATADYQAAQSDLRVKSAPAKPEDVAAAQQAVEGARAQLTSAQARLDQLRGGARREDIDAARASQSKASAALADARAALDATAANNRLDINDFDVNMAQKKADVARVTYEGLQAQLEMARVRAPFDGVITFITGKQGDNFDAFSPIAVISDPNRIQVSAELNSSDTAKVSPGQETIVTTEAFGSKEIHGKVVRTPGLDSGVGSGPLSGGNARAVILSFEPPGPGARLGQLAQVTIITQQKDDVLLIPNTAVRRFGQRKYVQVLGPDGRRVDVDVEVGLVTDTDTEITKGIREGQKVIVQ